MTVSDVMLAIFESELTNGKPRTSAVATMIRSPGYAFETRETVATRKAISPSTSTI
jgi:hypothetical protein